MTEPMGDRLGSSRADSAARPIDSKEKQAEKDRTLSSLDIIPLPPTVPMSSNGKNPFSIAPAAEPGKEPRLVRPGTQPRPEPPPAIDVQSGATGTGTGASRTEGDRGREPRMERDSRMERGTAEAVKSRHDLPVVPVGPIERAGAQQSFVLTPEQIKNLQQKHERSRVPDWARLPGEPEPSEIDVLLYEGAERKVGAPPKNLHLQNEAVTDFGARQIGRAIKLETLNMRGTQITDAGATYIGNLKELGILDLSETKLTDEGVLKLRGLSNLSHLFLGGCKLTDKAVTALDRMQDLAFLDLSGCRITDASVEQLSRLRNLHSLNLNDTDITIDGVRRLRAVLPQAEIHWNRPNSLPHTGDVLAELNTHKKAELATLATKLRVCSGRAETAKAEQEIRNFLAKHLGNMILEDAWPSIFQAMRNVELIDQKEECARWRAEVERMFNPYVTDARPLITAFEARCDSQEIPHSERIAFYAQIKRLGEAPTVEIAEKDRGRLVHDLLANAADPQKIDQGHHNTCNVTTLESRLFSRSPSQVARVVADVAITGQFVSADRTLIRPRSLMPDAEASVSKLDGFRNYASQIFQVVAANIHWQRHDTLPDGIKVGKGNIVYCQETPVGEYLLDCSQNPPVKYARKRDDDHPHLTIEVLAQINEQILGRPEEDFALQRFQTKQPGVHNIQSEQHMRDVLSRLKTEKKFPLLVMVDAHREPLGTGQDCAPHAVTIVDYDPVTGQVHLDNQWGAANDHSGKPGELPKLTSEQFYAVMDMSKLTQVKPADMWERVKSFGVDDVFEGAKAGFTSRLFVGSLAPLMNRTLTTTTVQGLERAGVSFVHGAQIRAGVSAVEAAELRGGLTMLQGAELRAGSNFASKLARPLVAGAAIIALHDIPGAFHQGYGKGTGRLARATTDMALFEGGYYAGSRLVRGSAGKLAGGKLGVALGFGLVAASLWDVSLGRSMENAFSLLDRK